MTFESRRVVLLLLVIAATTVVCSSTGAQTTPENPSYKDKWIETNVQSSPFLELRNEGDTEEPEEPSVPDTPTVEEPDDPAVEESSPEESPDDENTVEPETADTPAETTAAETEPVDENEAGPSESSSADEPGSTGDGSTEPKPASDAATESVAKLLQGLDPVVPGVLARGFETVSELPEPHDVPLGETSLNAEPVEPAPESYDPPFWWVYRYWLLGGLVVLFVTGMFFWSRRRRVTVIERNYPSAEDFFQDELKRSRHPDTSSEDTGVDGSRISPGASVSPQPTSSPSESLLESLDERGFDEQHQALVVRYYEEGLTRREAAEESPLGEGEAGLVLDLADRIREEKTHAERA